MPHLNQSLKEAKGDFGSDAPEDCFNQNSLADVALSQRMLHKKVHRTGDTESLGVFR